MSSSDPLSEHSLRHTRIWWLLGWCILGLILVLSLMPSPPQVGVVSDKWQHGFAYAVLMSWFAQLSPRHLKLSLLLVAMGIAVEFVQGWGGMRHFDVLDMVANTIGVVFGWVLIRVGVNYLSWFEL